jgi:hypothetical protein
VAQLGVVNRAANAIVPSALNPFNLIFILLQVSFGLAWDDSGILEAIPKPNIQQAVFHSF